MPSIALGFNQNIARSCKRIIKVLLLTAALAVAPYRVAAQSAAGVVSHWRTYLGGNADDRVLAVANDPFGHVFVAGRTTGGLLLANDTTGQSGLTHQPDFGGGASDAFVAKFAPQGSMLWCTYFGGLGDEEAVALVVTGMEGLYLVGHSTSDEGIATDSCLQSMRGGGTDVFVAHFTEYGLLLGATYFGGPGEELATSAALAHNSRLAICGRSSGTGTFPSGTALVQDWSGAQDGFVALLAGTDSLAYGTYVGGEGDDELAMIAATGNTGFVLLGSTTSVQGIASADAMAPNSAGGSDAFVIRVDTSLVQLRGTYFGGEQDDHAEGLALYEDRIAICGSTFSDSLHTDSTSYQSARAGDSDGFLAVLDDSLQLSWSTFLGDTMEDGLTAVIFDQTGRLYAAGFSHADSSAAPDSLQLGVEGPSDAFILRSDTAQSISWMRRIGAMGEEEAHALCIQGNTALYVGGITGSSSGFTFMGHQMEFGGGALDGFLTRMDQYESTICEGICTGTSTSASSGGGSCNGVSLPLPEYHLCLGESITFMAFGGALGAGAEWMWYADECGIPEHFLTMGDTITITPQESFVLSVRAESAYFTSACRYLPIFVHQLPQLVVSISDSVCVGAPLTMNGAGPEAFEWIIADTTIAGTPASYVPTDPGDVPVMAVGTSGPGCSASVALQVYVRPGPQPHWIVTDVSCHEGDDGSVMLDSLSTEPLTVQWQPDQFEGAAINGLESGAYVATTTDPHGCMRTDSLLVGMPLALMDSVSTLSALCGGAVGSAHVMTSSAATGLSFDWGNGPVADASIDGLAPGSYIVAASDSAGCQEVMAFIILDFGSIAVSIAADTLVAEEGEAMLDCSVLPADTAASFLWLPAMGLDDPTVPNPMCTITDTLIYFVNVTSSAGCTARDSVLVVPYFAPFPSLPPPCGEAFLPDIFSPNDDGLNDALCVMGGCYTSLALNVYDRWGQRIYASNDPASCWDGRLDGQPLPAGVYAFTLAAERSNGVVVERSGTITLQR